MMNIIKKATNNQKAIAVALLVSAAQFAMADGFADANAAATKFRTGLYAFVGILFSITLLWAFFQARGGRKSWQDILEECLYIVGAGASLALVGWLFATGGKMSF